MAKFPVHYRYEDGVMQEGVVLIEKKFYPIRETTHFYFVLEEWEWKIYKNGVINSYEKKAKRVSKNGRVRKCYPSKELAMQSYIARKKAQAMHAQDALDRAKYALQHLNEQSNFDDLKNSKYQTCKLLGRPDFVDNYIFD